MKLVVAGVVLYLVGIAVGIFTFRQVLRPGQQQRIINSVPFMTAFLPPRPGAGSTVPTPLPPGSANLSLINLLSGTDEPPEPSPIAPVPTIALPTLAPPVILDATSPSVPEIIPTATSIPPTTSKPDAPAPLAHPPSAHLNGFTPVRQTWNNCGPATITMALSLFGWTGTQEIAAAFLKPDPEDKNVSPREMVALVNQETGVRAITRMGGNIELLKTLIANRFPVIISIGFAPEGYDWLGHYRLLVGYDDNQRSFHAYDSYLGTGEALQGMVIPDEEIESAWKAFNRDFIVLYRSTDEEQLRRILGNYADPALAARTALDTSRLESRTNPKDGFAWFNMGTALVALGRNQEAALAYDQSRIAGVPWRMLWYQFGPYEAYFNIGRYDDVLALVQSNLNNGGSYVEETYYWQGRVYAAEGNSQDARQAFKNAVHANSRYQAAQDALNGIGDG